jgi:hypothetical protein
VVFVGQVLKAFGKWLRQRGGADGHAHYYFVYVCSLWQVASSSSR